ncbi:glycosyltransferase family 29 protein [uncultured Sulfitobacter sp.]|uniref:glycosyltransferase family 29 protein n=1 Tax=uncultured Sulfitobacter sp. TaxID=191468 RepID=UPI0026374264|nr:glycosyltransferase family 29 protein [uncultured Sulfitobacter sp.]
MTKIAIVGNAPFKIDLADDIDQADIVVRFNNAHGFGQDRGARVDDLFLVNCGGQPLEWMRTQDFWDQPHVIATPKVTLPIASQSGNEFATWDKAGNPTEIDGVNIENELRTKLERMGKVVQTLPRQTYSKACRTVANPDGSFTSAEPSTGFLAIFHYLNTARQDDVIELFGFGFAGWDGHAWQRECAWVEQQEAIGKLIWRRPP